MTETNEWNTGIELQPPLGLWEEIRGSNFYRTFWQELAVEESSLVLNTPLLINGKKRRIADVGWQMLDHGFTKLHEELIDEEMFIPTGRVIMGTAFKTGGVTTEEVVGFVPELEISHLTFLLAVADKSGLEHLTLKALGNKSHPYIPKLVTKANASHQTVSIGRSMFLVVKHGEY